MIDCHSHLGNDSFHPIEGNVREYIKMASKMGITSVNMMPVPCPVYKEGNDTVHSLVWSFEKSKIKLSRKIIKQNGEVILIRNPVNPYKEYNKIIEESISKVKDFKINFIPLMHPILDTIEHVKEVLAKKPTAIKIHGIATGVDPQEISPRFWKTIKESDIPIIIHTDYWKGEVKDGLYHQYKKNPALVWIKIFEKYGIRSFITHGARLCPESMQIINASNNFLVGIAPDLLLCDEPERMYSTKEYIKTLISQAGYTKVAFDLDYPWNITKRGEKILEWGALDRLAAKVNKTELQCITKTNAKKFFKLQST